MTKLYRIVSYVLDLNGGCPTKDDVVVQIENSRYPEFHSVKQVLETGIEEWTDDHPLNKTDAVCADFDAHFAELDAKNEKDPWFKQEHQRVRSIMLQQIQKNQTLQSENEELKRKIKGLEKVQEFVNTVKDLAK